MTAFKRGKKGNQSIYVPTRHGGLVQRSCGTAVPSLVRGMKRMVIELRDRSMASGNWAILDAVFTNRARLFEVYTAYTSGQLADLEARLSAKNIAASLAGWIGWVRANRDADARTADVYWQQVTTLVPQGGTFLAIELTKERVMDWLASRAKASSGTRRKYLYALKSFVRYLVDTGVLAADPLAGLQAPKKNRARRRCVTADIDEQIVRATIPKYRALFAFIKGTGCDVGSALRAQRGDVNVFGKRANIRGTKTDRRQVHGAAIEPWAIEYLDRRAISATPRHALLFPDLTRNGATKHHARICETLGVDDYTLKDSRHSVGVRMRKAGRSFEEIAAQLGSSVYQIVTVYAAYDVDEQAAQEAK